MFLFTMSAIMLLGGFPVGTDYDDVLQFVESRCKGIQSHVTLVYMRLDAHGKGTGVAEVHLGQRAWPAFCPAPTQKGFSPAMKLWCFRRNKSFSFKTSSFTAQDTA